MMYSCVTEDKFSSNSVCCYILLQCFYMVDNTFCYIIHNNTDAGTKRCH